jgi:multidrug resistance efflux pump
MVDAAEAQVSTAETQLSYTDLLADGPGVVTARGAEPGEVVAAGRMVVRLAHRDREVIRHSFEGQDSRYCQ